jgi:uncharacterized membrane protein YvlD (DUF360 family)
VIALRFEASDPSFEAASYSAQVQPPHACSHGSFSGMHGQAHPLAAVIDSTSELAYPARMHLLLKLLIFAGVIALSPKLVAGVAVAGFGAAVRAALLYGVLFVLIGWFVKGLVAVFSIVPGILTFGLFFLVIPLIANTILLRATAGLMRTFEIRTWGAAFMLSAILSVVNYVFESKVAH